MISERYLQLLGRDQWVGCVNQHVHLHASSIVELSCRCTAAVCILHGNPMAWSDARQTPRTVRAGISYFRPYVASLSRDGITVSLILLEETKSENVEAAVIPS